MADVYIKHLAVEGFKSFPELNTLELLPGSCILVGSNGTGKTNVADALLWVLGQDDRELLRVRSNDDFIFAGSEELFPVEYARATVVLDRRPDRTKGQGLPATVCTHGHAATHDAELTEGILSVSRELEQDGTERFYLNGERAAPGAVEEALTEIGVAYPPVTVIRQGELERLLLLDPQTRREEMEEAAGIPGLLREERRLLAETDELFRRRRRVLAERRELRSAEGKLTAECQALDRSARLEEERRQLQAEMVRLALGQERRYPSPTRDRLLDILGLPEPDGSGESPSAIGRRIDGLTREIDGVGPLNARAPWDLEALEGRLRTIETRIGTLERGIDDRETELRDLRSRMELVFDETRRRIEGRFRSYYGLLAPGGEASFHPTGGEAGKASGIEVLVRPPRKVLDRVTSLSGGERSLASLALALSLFQEYGSPFFVLDEVEPALDDTNIRRLQAVLDRVADTRQLIVISHQQRAKETGDAVFGIERNLDGASQVKYRYEPSTRDLQVFRRTWAASHLRRYPGRGPTVAPGAAEAEERATIAPGSPTQAAIMALRGPGSGPSAFRTKSDGTWQGIWEEVDPDETEQRDEDETGENGPDIEPCC